MALLHADSFDHYATALIAQKYGTVQLTLGSAVITVSSSAGRHSTSGLRFTWDPFNPQLVYVQTSHPVVAPSGTTAIVGAAWRFAGISANATFNGVMAVMNPGGSAAQCSVRVNADLSLSVMRGTSSGTVLGTTAPLLTLGTFYYLELKVVIHTSAGSYDLRVNGVSVLTGSSANTAAAGTNDWGSVRLGATVNGPINTTWDVDDVVVLDGTGTLADCLGDVRVAAHLPDGAGTYAEWTRGGTDSGANWSQVEEVAANSDTDYVSATLTGKKDSYTFEAFKVPGQTILGVQAVLQAKKTEAGTASVGPLYRIGSTDYAPSSGTAVSLDAYTLTRAFRSTSPATGTAWTESEFNALEAGPVQDHLIMADSKLIDLPALTTPSSDDLLYIVDDPAGTPVSKKITYANLTAGVGGGGGGVVVQVKSVQTGAVLTGSTVIPFDDTIPQITEGDQYLSLAITPTNATHWLRFDVVLFLACATASRNKCVALFQGATANAIACGLPAQASAAFTDPIPLTHVMVAGTTSATTFTVRAGVDTSGTNTVNGSGGARRYGGVLVSSLTITEIVP